MESAISGDGCIHSYKTPQSSTPWYNGIWNNNEYGIRHVVMVYGCMIQEIQQ